LESLVRDELRTLIGDNLFLRLKNGFEKGPLYLKLGKGRMILIYKILLIAPCAIGIPIVINTLCFIYTGRPLIPFP
jgi:hypothetical protein